MNVFKVLIINNHNILKAGLRVILSKYPKFKLIDNVSNEMQAIIQAIKQKIDIIILDYEMPIYNGIYIANKIINELPEAKILMISNNYNHKIIFEAIDTGILGFISKDVSIAEFLEALDKISQGEYYYKGKIAELIVPHLINKLQNKKSPISSHKNKELLSKREIEIVKLYCEGFKTSNIAEKLFISPRTVEVHKTNIIKKIKGNNIADIIRYAIINKLADL